MIGLLAAISVAALALASRIETGARDWQGDVARRNAKQARKDARRTRKRRTTTTAPRRRTTVDCCDASDDQWRSARDVYDHWTAPSPMSYREALAVCWDESHKAAAAGDYSKPATRRCALGKMHANKLLQWDDCREACRRAGKGSDPLLESVGSESVIRRWPADDGSGGVCWTTDDGDDIVRIAPDDGAWRVDILRLGAWHPVDSYDDEEGAEDRARELLESPF